MSDIEAAMAALRQAIKDAGTYVEQLDAKDAEIERLVAEIAELKKPRGYHDVDEYYRDEAKEVRGE